MAFEAAFVSSGMTREGLAGNYLFELKAHPGWPQGRSLTTTGSKPINVIERPDAARPLISLIPF
jgi:hypothetical protein